jgi:hypothetical protein
VGDGALHVGDLAPTSEELNVVEGPGRRGQVRLGLSSTFVVGVEAAAGEAILLPWRSGIPTGPGLCLPPQWGPL